MEKDLKEPVAQSAPLKKKYKIIFSKARQGRGVKAWGVFEIVDENFSRGISQHSTEEEAKATLAQLEAEKA